MFYAKRPFAGRLPFERESASGGCSGQADNPAIRWTA